MILLDANLLIYAYDAASPHHQAARSWLEERLSRPEPVALAWMPIVAFVRITTNPRVFEQPFTLGEASAAVASWLARENVLVIGPTQRHWPIFERLLADGRAAGALASDAHLAALAVEHGALLCTTDRDFARFSELRWADPLDEGR